MIQINKSQTDPDISVYKHNKWKGPNGVKMPLAQRDLLKAIDYYGDPEKFNNNKRITQERPIKFEAYSHKETKNELKKIFKGKCAYCESVILHIEPGDIEHFRPKAEISGPNGEELIPGYYWLGADWNNLLLSCINCNRPNKLLVNGLGEPVLMGKANEFPLSDETKRIRHHNDDYFNEAPYVQIINPCIENALDHLIFDDNGQVRSIDIKGQKSIEVYGLFRADLVNRRKKTAGKLIRTLKLLVLELKDIEEKFVNNLPIDRSLEKLEVHSETLMNIFDENAEYLGLKQQVLTRFIDHHPTSYQRLVNYGIDLNQLIH